MTWPCPTCTFINSRDSATKCSLCGLDRGPIATTTNSNSSLYACTPKTDRETEKKGTAASAAATTKKKQSVVVDLTSSKRSSSETTAPLAGTSSKHRKRHHSSSSSDGGGDDDDDDDDDDDVVLVSKKPKPLLSRSENKTQESSSSSRNPAETTEKSKMSLAPIFTKHSRGENQKTKHSNKTLSSTTAAASAPAATASSRTAAAATVSSRPTKQQKIFNSTLKSCHSHSFSRTVLPKRTVEEATKDTQEVLREVFGLQELRNLQPTAIKDALQLQSQLIVMATGGGKSLCYQLPACLLGGVTIVISPLLALMKDQVEALNAKGIPAACINSNQTEKQNRTIQERLLSSSSTSDSGDGGRNNQKKSNKNSKKLSLLDDGVPCPVLLYITPESIQTDRMRSILESLNKQSRLGMFAVDEAHCLSSWGHDFRVSYRRLHYLRETFPNVPCMACTATATPQVIQDITNELHLSGCPKHVGSFDRSNIFYKVKYKDGLDDPLQDLIKYVKGRHEESAKNGKLCSGIIYCHKRDETSMLARAITLKAGVNAKPYHAGLKKDERNNVQELWSNNEVQVAVATVAFGMGIDLAHVRYVVHWSLPKSVEGFYQESGRAGRDGLPSHSLLYYSKDDAQKFRYLIRMQSENSKGAKAMSMEEKRKAERNMDRKLDQLDAMEKYCSLAKCRRNTLISHFGGTAVKCNKSCDYCNNPKKVERAIASAKSTKDIRHQQQTMTGKKKFGEEIGPSGNMFDDDEDQDNNDWGWGVDEGGWVVNGLKITGPMEVDTDFDSTAGSTSKTGTSKATKAGFSKASDILSKYEKMEKRAATESDSFVGFKKASDLVSSKSSRGVSIPSHLMDSLSAAASKCTSNNKSKTVSVSQKMTTSAEHGAKADSIEEQLKKLKAESEERMAALRAKNSSKKRPPPPPAPLSFGSKKK